MSDHSHNPAPTLDATPEVYGVMGEFHDVDSVIAAAEKIRDAGFVQWDVHSPFPIHGIDRAMGIRPTILPWIVLGGGITGLLGGLVLSFWANATSLPGLPYALPGYQMLISGKPIWSLPANIPVIFETTVLLSAFGAVFGMLLLNRLPMLYHPLFKSARFARVTDDRFFVVIEATDPRFDRKSAAEFLRSLGAHAVEEIEE